MKKLLVAIACFSLFALVAGAGNTGKPAPSIEGSWTATGGSDAGKKIPPDDLKKLMLVVVFKEGKYTVSIQGKEVEKGEYKTYPNKTPSAIDMHVDEGKDKGKKQIGIYKMEGNQMTMAVVIGGKDRPKTFDPAPHVEVRELTKSK